MEKTEQNVEINQLLLRFLTALAILLTSAVQGQVEMRMGHPVIDYAQDHDVPEGRVWVVSSMDKGCRITAKSVTSGVLVLLEPTENPFSQGCTIISDFMGAPLEVRAPFPVELKGEIKVMTACVSGRYMRISMVGE